jgi:hypothetical protein
MENVFGNIMLDGRNTLGSKGKKTSKVVFPWFFFFLVVPIDQRSLMTMVGKLFCEPWLNCHAEVQGCKQGIFQCAFPKVLYTVIFSCVPTKGITQNHCCSLLLLLLCVFSSIHNAIFFISDFVQFACILNSASGSTPLGQMILAIVLWSSLICYFLRSQFCFQTGAHFKGLDCQPHHDWISLLLAEMGQSQEADFC